MSKQKDIVNIDEYAAQRLAAAKKQVEDHEKEDRAMTVLREKLALLLMDHQEK